MTGFDRISARRFGGPDVLEIEHCAHLPEPAEGEVRVRVDAAGIGYTDTILRRGRYMAYTGGLPLTPGYDMVGIVDKLGPAVGGVRVGDRVADMSVSGAYSQYIVSPAQDLVPVPDGVDPAAAVEVPLMWVTAWQMLTRVASLQAGDAILVVGAGGAVGRGLVLLGRHLGLRVIGTCSAASIPPVEAMGATALPYDAPDLTAAIRSATGGAGVAAAFDAIGGRSWETSWNALGQNGMLVAYGFQDFLDSDAPPSVAGDAMARLKTWNAEGASDGTNRSTTFYDIHARRRSLPADYRADAEHLLALIAKGIVVPRAAEILSLGQAAEAHRRIAAGGLQRRLVLQPTSIA